METLTITESEILDAISKAAAGSTPKHAKTVDEISRATNVSKMKVRDAIGRLAMQNRVEVHMVRRLDISLRPTSRPAYTILPAQKKGAKK